MCCVGAELSKSKVPIPVRKEETMFDPATKRRKTAEWMIGVVTACILIYLGVRHIEHVAAAILWVIDLFKPLLLGLILALILNVPMSAIEKRLLVNVKCPKIQRLRRPLALALALLFVFGLFIGVAFLVVPELVGAVKLITQIIMSWIDNLARLEGTINWSFIPFGEQISQVDIDWMGLKTHIEQWFTSQSGDLVDRAVNAIGVAAGNIVNAFVGIVFSAYTLARKDQLKSQCLRLIRAWLPERFGASLLHVCGVCGITFRQFIVGQAMEAVILGTLCMIGMAILGIPYAPMIGALIGVTALIPVVGAFFGTIIGTVMILTVNPFKAFVFVIFLLILQQVEGNLIYPRVVGSKTNLPAMWVLAAVTVGGGLAGPVGMLLGVPTASAVYALLREATLKREQKLKETKTAH